MWDLSFPQIQIVSLFLISWINDSLGSCSGTLGLTWGRGRGDSLGYRKGAVSGGYTMGVDYLPTKFRLINNQTFYISKFISFLNFSCSLCQPSLVGLGFEGKLKHVTLCSGDEASCHPRLLEVHSPPCHHPLPPTHPHPPTPPPPGGQWTNCWAVEAAKAWRNIQSWNREALNIS